jgi:DNA-binding transcriptional regulator YhcF (GntR family)
LQQPLPENETEHQIDPNVQIPNTNVDKKYQYLVSIQKQFVELIKPMIIRDTISNEHTISSTFNALRNGSAVYLQKNKGIVSTNKVSELFKKIQQCEIKRHGYKTYKQVGNGRSKVFEYDNSPHVRNDLRNSVFELRKFEKSLGEIIDVFDQQISPNSLKLWYSKREQYEITAYERFKYGLRNLLGLNNNRPIKPMLFKNFKLLNITIQNAINLLNKAGAIIKTHVEENVKRETEQKTTPSSSYLLLKQGREFNRIVKTSHYTILYFCYEVYSDIALKIIMNEQYTSPSQKQYQEPDLNKLPNYHHNPTRSHYSGTSPTANNDTSIPYDTNFPMGQSNGLLNVFYQNNYQPYSNTGSAGFFSVSNHPETKTDGGRRKPVRKNNKKPDIKKSKPRRNNKVRIN